MYDINKRIEINNLTVGELKRILTSIPDNCEIQILESKHGYIHMEGNLSILRFDNNSLQEEYNKVHTQNITINKYNNIGTGDIVFDIVRVGKELTTRVCKCLTITDSEITLLSLDNKTVKYHATQYNNNFFTDYNLAQDVIVKDKMYNM